MKILYAASNNIGSKIQLSRFLNHLTGHQIKIAAYKKSSPKNINIDWCLDALLNVYKPELLSLNNDNLNIYFEQVKSFAPDLIISDLEYFTSYIANILNITLWQCSSSLINYALTKREKYNLGLFKFYAHSLNREPSYYQRTINLIDNSARNLVYSHYGDLNNPPNIYSNFEWIRPYNQISKLYAPCQHYITAAIYNKNVLNELKKYQDCVVFMDSCNEKYPNILIKDINNQEEYYCNLRNSVFSVCQGQTSFLADAFYNNKYSLTYTDYDDAESIINGQISQKLNLSHIASYSDDLSKIKIPEINAGYKNSIHFLHEKIKDIE